MNSVCESVRIIAIRRDLRLITEAERDGEDANGIEMNVPVCRYIGRDTASLAIIRRIIYKGEPATIQRRVVAWIVKEFTVDHFNGVIPWASVKIVAWHCISIRPYAKRIHALARFPIRAVGYNHGFVSRFIIRARGKEDAGGDGGEKQGEAFHRAIRLSVISQRYAFL